MAARGRKQPRVPQTQNPPPQNNNQQHQIQVTRSQWQGPLPPPAILHEFDQIVPGAAERILKEFELEAHHRRSQEAAELRFIGRDMFTGQLLAILFALGALAVAAFAASVGAEWIGSIVGGGTIVAVVVAFLRQRKNEK